MVLIGVGLATGGVRVSARVVKGTTLPNHLWSNPYFTAGIVVGACGVFVFLVGVLAQGRLARIQVTCGTGIEHQIPRMPMPIDQIRGQGTPIKAVFTTALYVRETRGVAAKGVSALLTDLQPAQARIQVPMEMRWLDALDSVPVMDIPPKAPRRVLVCDSLMNGAGQIFLSGTFWDATWERNNPDATVEFTIEFRGENVKTIVKRYRVEHITNAFPLVTEIE